MEQDTLDPTATPYEDAVDVPGESGPPSVLPIPVSGAVAVLGTVSTADAAPDYTAWTTTAFAGSNADQPVEILPYDPHRRRAVIIAVGAAPAVLWLGTEGQVKVILAAAIGAGTTQGAGIPLPAGQQVVVTGRQPVWAMSNLANAISALVINERDGD